MTVRLFRAGDEERQLDSLADIPTKPSDDELVWVDLERSDPDLATAITTLGMDAAADRLRRPSDRPELLRQDEVVIVSAIGLRDDEEHPEPVTIDIAAHGNLVLTIRDGSIAGLEDTIRVSRGRTGVGSLDAATFVAVLLDGLLGAYFEATEDIEREIDRLDDVALGPRSNEGVLERLLPIRRRVSILRRSLAPHRTVIAKLARPDLGLRSTDDDDPWPALVERLERAIEAVEHARELLVGSFDIVMAQTGQRTNDIVRVLTVVSVTLLPAGVIAGIFGMNFHAQLFEIDGLFWPVVAAIAALCGSILVVAKVRGWL